MLNPKFYSDEVRRLNPELFGPDATEGKEIRAAQPTLEDKFLEIWNTLIDAPLQREFKFEPTTADWRFDFALPDIKVAIEIEGGTYSGGRHVRGQGYMGDCIKYNRAAMLGWTVLRLTSDMVRENYVDMLANFVTNKLLELGGDNE